MKELWKHTQKNAQVSAVLQLLSKTFTYIFYIWTYNEYKSKKTRSCCRQQRIFLVNFDYLTIKWDVEFKIIKPNLYMWAHSSFDCFFLQPNINYNLRTFFDLHWLAWEFKLCIRGSIEHAGTGGQCFVDWGSTQRQGLYCRFLESAHYLSFLKYKQIKSIYKS